MTSRQIFLTLCVVLGFSYMASAQLEIYPNKYWIQFTDKARSPYSIESPEAYLSQRAIDRRKRHNIPITQQDLPVNPHYVKAVEEAGAKILNTSKWFNGVTIFCENPDALAAIQALPFVGNFKTAPKKPIRQGSQTELDDKRPSRYLLTAFPQVEKDSRNVYEYGGSGNQIIMLNGHILHNWNKQGQGVVIGVIDAGFYRTNELPSFARLWEDEQILGVYDFVDGDTSVFDASDHGMKVLSTMGGYMPGQLIGTAPKAHYWLLRSEDSDSEYLIEEFNWVSAAEFADSVGVNIINSSLGYSDFDDPTQSHTYEDLDGNTCVVTIGADIAASKGILVVTSAGNEGNDPWRYIGAPADGDSVLAIGAVDSERQYVYFSSVGPSADGRIKPDVLAKGLGTTVQGRIQGISSSNGTSFSGPITAGMVACLWQDFLTLDNMTVIDALKHCSSQYANPDSLMGYGIPDYAAAYLYLQSIEDQGGDSDDEGFIKVYPNPFRDYLNVEVMGTRKEILSIVFRSTDGQVMLSKVLKTYDLQYKHLILEEVQALPPALYIIEIDTGSSRFKQLLIKS